MPTSACSFSFSLSPRLASIDHLQAHLLVNLIFTFFLFSLNKILPYPNPMALPAGGSHPFWLPLLLPHCTASRFPAAGPSPARALLLPACCSLPTSRSPTAGMYLYQHQRDLQWFETSSTCLLQQTNPRFCELWPRIRQR